MGSEVELHSKKLKPQLAEWLRQRGKSQAQPVRILIHLSGYELPPRESSLSRTQHVERCQQVFERLARPVKRAVENLGGTVEAPGAWLTGSLCAEIPSDTIPALLKSEEIESVDLVRQIAPEALSR